ncbi:hypothetical protein SAMN05216259_107246 [Actinacidiphila guanduensis]|uniref:Uncharacterized protein n=1 Tax=Actinacidiphila guanduensis TaxID=310781 RepID=A0A1H0GSP8_9ACTN|nr:hypothetical protein SAMN05216259_107246 [Actinacidiphila guanduensis]
MLKKAAAVGATAACFLWGAASLSAAHAAEPAAPRAAVVHSVPTTAQPDITKVAGCSISYTTHEADAYCDSGSRYYGEDYYLYIEACNVDGCEYFRGTEGLNGETVSIANVGSNWFISSGSTDWVDFE